MARQGDRDWFSVDRALLSHDLWLSDPFTRGQAWVDLIGLANWGAGYIRVRGARVDLERGQLGHSLRYYAQRWRWSVGKVNRFLNELKTERMVELSQSAVTTVVTITNYDRYQSGGTQNGTLTEQSRNTDGTLTEQNKQETTITNKKQQQLGRAKFAKPSVEEVAAYCRERGNSVNPQQWFDHYEANGWKVGKNAMRDWKAAVRTWERNRVAESRGSPSDYASSLDQAVRDLNEIEHGSQQDSPARQSLLGDFR